MSEYTVAVRKIRDFYSHKPGAPFYQREFGFYVMDRWVREGYVKPADGTPEYRSYLRGLFGFDEEAVARLGGLGGCEAELLPRFETTVLEDRGSYELAQDFAGRKVLYFKGRRSGFMPEYVDHPVKDIRSFEENILWRMDPRTPARTEKARHDAALAAEKAERGFVVHQAIVGGYMYLRSLIGPMELPLMFYDDPQLIHACMRAWLALAEAVTAEHQKLTAIDEVMLDEDICYKNGLLISPDMIREFLLPYYSQLMTGIARRNPGGRAPVLQLNTDGHCEPAIPLYCSVGCGYVAPFEIAAEQDIVALGRKYPDLLMSGGIDKRVLATTPDEIDRYLDRVLPPMRERGGFLPTCDHGVPEEVSFKNYMHYRRRMFEYAD